MSHSTGSTRELQYVITPSPVCIHVSVRAEARLRDISQHQSPEQFVFINHLAVSTSSGGNKHVPEMSIVTSSRRIWESQTKVTQTPRLHLSAPFDLQTLSSIVFLHALPLTRGRRSQRGKATEISARNLLLSSSSLSFLIQDDLLRMKFSSQHSLFHRIQMDPMEKEWLRCAALGKAPALHMLLQQDNTLVSRKDFVTEFTALHWAAKQGCVEMADMMARSGADVNQRAGYTPLHLASLHGHGNIIQLLINNYIDNAKVNIRDYHGKMAAHYWNGTMDIFNKHGSHSACRWSGGRRGQCYAQLSALLSRSHGNINVEMCAHSPLTRTSQTPTP
ncbi:putative ankyrin repeat domain-containing protein SOWAHA-like [Triplophysa rosa]|uniref:Ankyrin repeat domain-containing protein SOWAHA-like n=1 Tax=Triplophysa rosa TaxID=992332 RepID=A0A9W8C9T5_TRIRA|nr:putative ankyrin repeat domain-containing protein SOWAHA-like [Triplophysa rosa]